MERVGGERHVEAGSLLARRGTVGAFGLIGDTPSWPHTFYGEIPRRRRPLEGAFKRNVDYMYYSGGLALAEEVFSGDVGGREG